MHRVVQVGIALLVLSVRLWGKLFFVSEYLGKYDFTWLFTKENITYGVLAFIASYYIVVKVLQQMIWRARMRQSGAVLCPYWFPFIGNYVAIAKVAIGEQAKGSGKNVFALIPQRLLSNEHGMVPAMTATNSVFPGGLLLINSCELMDTLLIKNSKNIDKTDDIPKLLSGYGGRSFVFTKNSKWQVQTKKTLKHVYTTENTKKSEVILRKLVYDRLELLQKQGTEGKVNFNISHWIQQTVLLFSLKMIFGDQNIGCKDEMVRINVDGKEQDVSFCVAFRLVWRQNGDKMGNPLRLFMLDPLTDWSLTPGERRTKSNQQVIKKWLQDKYHQHREWRTKNPINLDTDIVYSCDMFMADKKLSADETYVIEELVNMCFGFAATTISTQCQVLYQLIKHSDKREKLIESLKSHLEQEESDESTSKGAGLPFSASLVKEKLDIEADDDLMYLERCIMEALRIDPPLALSSFSETLTDVKLPNGERLPKGTKFSFNFAAIHRDVNQYHLPADFIPERYSRSSEYYLTPGKTQRHPLSWCPFMTGNRQCNGNRFAFMTTKTVTAMMLAAMPNLTFKDEKLISADELPSSSPDSPITVDVCATTPFKL